MPPPAPRTSGDPLPPDCGLIEVRVAELRQLFNPMDASPFRQRDLDPAAEEFIVTWARELPHDAPLAIAVYLDRPAGLPDEASTLRETIREFFKYRRRTTGRKLQQLLRRGRISLLIGLVFLAALVVLGDAVAGALAGRRLGEILREGLLIGGWVAMWRPLEVFLYDWWPIRAEMRLHERLSAMPVRITYTAASDSDDWRRDWPAASPRPVSQPLAPR
jgi:hypothetical protein